MIFEATKLAGSFVIRPERQEDDRGFFARTYCVRELSDAGLESEIVQRSVSYNKLRGTLRGMHYQTPPHEENKIVSCVRGTVHDVILDLRPSSTTYRQWFGVELSATAGKALFVPRGCAHGFITLEDDTVVSYDISTFYEPDAARGIRYDDPGFGIVWPLEPVVISERDRSYPAFQEGR